MTKLSGIILDYAKHENWNYNAMNSKFTKLKKEGNESNEAIRNE